MKDNTLYLECFSGISGDMTVAALLDLGADESILIDGLESLNVDGYHIKIQRTRKNGIDACDFDVVLDAPDPNEAHWKMDAPAFQEMVPETLIIGRYLHRNLVDINRIIDNSSITYHAKSLAKKIFHIIAVAESKAHRLPIENVFFHELGATDSIIDIVAAAICLDNLNITDVICSELYEGTGFIPYRYGHLPVPVPAVMEILSAYNLPICTTNINGEMITPTGAAIAAGIRSLEHLPSRYKIIRTGLGAGKRNYATAGVLRAMLIEDVC